MKIAIFAFIFILTSCSTTKSSAVNDKNKKFKEFSDFICQQIKPSPKFEYELYFSKEFQAAIKHTDILNIFSTLYNQYGECSSTKISTEDGLSGHFLTHHKNNKKLSFTLVLKKEGNKYKVGGLLSKGEPAKPVNITSYNQLQNIIDSKKENFSFLFKKLNGETIYSHKSEARRPLGSTFKLYVLDALSTKIQNNNLNWQYKIPIKDEYKSLPSGVMQNSKVNNKFSLFEFASKMISISDNTATDHLIHYVGRENIEDHMAKSNYNSYLTDNQPFITTLELFKTRAFFDKNKVKQYKRSNRNQRLNLIKELNKYSKTDTLNHLKNWTAAKYIHDIEWFAKPTDICKLFNKLHNENSDDINTILSLNTPFIDTKKSKKWKFAGYKGGSEVGLIEMAYILIDKLDQPHCLYIGSNSDRNINQDDFFALVKGILSFLENN